MRLDNLWSRLIDRLVTLSLKRRGVAMADKVVVIGKHPRVVNQGRISLGSHVKFRSTMFRVRLKSNPNGNIAIGDRTFLNDGVAINSSVSISIGSHCLIGDGVGMFDTDYHEIEQGRPILSAPIKIGDNVWIGREALLMPGVEIGDHSVVGAGSVVTRSVPARSLVAGNPARIIREIEASPGYVRS